MKWFIFGTGFSLLMVLSAEDLRNRRIHAGLMVVLGVGLCVLQGLCPAIFGSESQFEMIHWCIGAIPGVALLVLGKLTGGRIGTGDGMVVFGAGLMTGGLLSFRIFMWSLLLIFIFSCIGLLTGKLRRHSCIPFVPFYTMAYIGGWIL